jgi:asparagine synthase (glutamine-hydrolysing)
MCGIAGIYGKNNKVQYSDLKTMGAKLAHRGPDGEGIWINEGDNVGFLHRRLSIIDLSVGGNQPMHYADRYTITFNGEIYNYIELKEKLLEKGYVFKSSSDTEVLMALYAEKGHDCVYELDGMFAFAIWDNQEKELFLTRDRFGEKPLYYGFIDGAFCWASEMKALFAIGASGATCPDRIYKYLKSNVIIDEEDTSGTFYKEVKQLDAADYMIVKGAEIKKLVKYWTLNNIEVNTRISIEDAALKFSQLLTKSIRLRLRSDVPVGSSLSGGIDSSAIVLIANGLKTKDQVQNTFSARFRNFKKDEGRFIDMVVRQAPNISSHNVWPQSEQLIEEIGNLAYHQEEPFYSGSQYNQYCVMRLAKEHNTTVLLDGQGADEQLGGYLHYYHHHLTHLITSDLPEFLRERREYQKIHSLLQPYRIPRRLPYWYLKKKLFNAKYPYDRDARSLLLRDTTTTGLKALLRYGDKNSMAFSREVRLPFLSHELAEFIFSLPMNYILRKGWTKYILREAVKGTVPDEITWRKDKIGYEPPQENWLLKLKPIIDEYRSKTNYLDLTGGRKVTEIVDWKWLMLKLFAQNG